MIWGGIVSLTRNTPTTKGEVLPQESEAQKSTVAVLLQPALTVREAFHELRITRSSGGVQLSVTLAPPAVFNQLMKVCSVVTLHSAIGLDGRVKKVGAS